MLIAQYPPELFGVKEAMRSKWLNYVSAFVEIVLKSLQVIQIAVQLMHGK